MFAIGEFSRLAQVTIKTLRHYDEAGLLKPARVDPDSGYRYYSAQQLPRLHRILVLKELGFTLEQVRLLLNEGVSGTELNGMLRLRQAEQAERLREEQFRLRQIETMIQAIQKEEEPMDIVIKQTEPRWIASIRAKLDSYPAIGMLYPELFAQLGPKSTSFVSICQWHDPDHRTSDIDGEAGLLLDGPVSVSGRARCYQLPAITVASYVHEGSIQSFRQSFGGMMKWMEANGWIPNGPAREIYLKLNMPVRQDDPGNITELQIPVERAPHAAA